MTQFSQVLERFNGIDAERHLETIANQLEQYIDDSAAAELLLGIAPAINKPESEMLDTMADEDKAAQLGIRLIEQALSQAKLNARAVQESLLARATTFLKDDLAHENVAYRDLFTQTYNYHYEMWNSLINDPKAAAYYADTTAHYNLVNKYRNDQAFKEIAGKQVKAYDTPDAAQLSRIFSAMYWDSVASYQNTFGENATFDIATSAQEQRYASALQNLEMAQENMVAEVPKLAISGSAENVQDAKLTFVKTLGDVFGPLNDVDLRQVSSLLGGFDKHLRQRARERFQLTRSCVTETVLKTIGSSTTRKGEGKELVVSTNSILSGSYEKAPSLEMAADTASTFEDQFKQAMQAVTGADFDDHTLDPEDVNFIRKLAVQANTMLKAQTQKQFQKENREYREQYLEFASKIHVTAAAALSCPAALKIMRRMDEETSSRAVAMVI